MVFFGQPCHFRVKMNHFWSQNTIHVLQNEFRLVKMNRFRLKNDNFDKNSHFVGSKFHPIKEHGDSVFGNDPILVKELKETIANQRVNQPIIAVKTYNET